MIFLDKMSNRINRVVCSTLLIVSIFLSILQWIAIEADIAFGAWSFIWNIDYIFLINPIFILVFGFLFNKFRNIYYSLPLFVSFILAFVLWIIYPVYKIPDNLIEVLVNLIVISLPSLLAVYTFIYLSLRIIKKEPC